jgi:hypothetical protein
LLCAFQTVRRFLASEPDEFFQPQHIQYPAAWFALAVQHRINLRPRHTGFFGKSGDADLLDVVSYKFSYVVGIHAHNVYSSVLTFKT